MIKINKILFILLFLMTLPALQAEEVQTAHQEIEDINAEIPTNEEADDISGLIKTLNIQTNDIPPSARAHIKVLEKFNGKTYEMIIDNASETPFEDDLKIKLIKCWKEPGKNLLDKYTALITVKDVNSKKSKEPVKHWVFNHNVELNTFSTDKYYIFLGTCN